MELSVKYKRVTLARLYTAEAVLLTGTAPGVVPVSEIDGRRLNIEHTLIEMLTSTYDQSLTDPNLSSAIA